MKIDFNALYRGLPPWEIGHPQPAFVQLEESGRIQGAVLDIGCGTGENALFLAGRAHPVWGVDFSQRAIELAQEKARERGLSVNFRCADALDMREIGRSFDTVIDSGLFHVFGNDDRARYVDELAELVLPGGRYFMICFSEEETREGGPRRVTREEIKDSFSRGWRVESLEPTRFEDHLHEGGSRAWLVAMRRLEEPGAST